MVASFPLTAPACDLFKSAMPFCKQISMWLVWLVFTAKAFAGIELPNTQTTRPFLYQVTDVSNRVCAHILGSLHILPSSVLTPSILELARTADGIAFEVDFTANPEFTLDPRFVLPPTQKLSELLSPRAWENVVASLTPEISVSEIERMHPVYVFSALGIVVLFRAMDRENSMDLQLQRLARERGIAIGALETAAEAIDAMKAPPGEFPLAQAIQALEEISPSEFQQFHLNLLQDQYRSMARDYLSGNEQSLKPYFSTVSGQFIESTIAARNRNWASRLAKFISEHRNSLIVVGVSHLLGEESVLTLLPQHGLRATRVDFPMTGEISPIEFGGGI